VSARRGRDADGLWRLVVRLPRGLRAHGRVRVPHAFVRVVGRRTIIARLRRARTRLTLVTALRGHARGRLRVAATAADGRITRVRLR
jgi:hypothetical protein